MNKKIDEIAFIIKMQEIFETENKINLSDKLHSIDDYDSLTEMVIASWITSTFNLSCNVDKIKNMSTIGEILEFINSKN